MQQQQMTPSERLSLTVSIASFFASALPELEQLYHLMNPVLADSPGKRNIIAEVQSLSKMVPLLQKDDASHALLTTAFELAIRITAMAGHDFQMLSSAALEGASHIDTLAQTELAADVQHVEALIEPLADEHEKALLEKQNQERLRYMHSAEPAPNK